MSDRGMAILEAAKMAPKKSEPDGDEPMGEDDTETDEGMLSAAEDVAAALGVDAADPKALARALKHFLEVC